MFSFNYARIEATINEISFSEGISTKFLRTAEMQAIAKTNMTKWLNQEYHWFSRYLTYSGNHSENHESSNEQC